MKRPAMIADILFYSFSTFLLSLCVLRYYRAPTAIAFLSAAMIACAIGGIAFLFLSSKNRKRIFTKDEQKARDALLLHLTLERPERVRKTLLEAYLADGKNAHCEGDELNVEGIPTVPLFSLEPVSADDVASLIRRFGGANFQIVCKSLSAEAEKLALSFGIQTFGEDSVYTLLSRTQTIPDPLICGRIPRKTVRQKFRGFFSKSNARPFFVSGVLLLIMSLISPFPVYYIVSGTVLLVTAIGVRLLGYAA